MKLVKLMPILLFFLLSSQVSAVPAMPKIHTLKQADGTEFKARLWGDEWNNGLETLDGYTIIFNESSGNWEYAVLGQDGKLKCSGKVVTKDLPNGIPKKVRPKANRPKGAPPLLSLSTSQSQRATPSTGTVNIPVILIRFPDQANTYTVADFENLIFNDTPGSKSMRAYYKEVSYRKLLLSGSVSGWYVADNVHDYYGRSQGDERAAELVKEAVQKADATIDFSKYDNDGDGYVDIVVIVHSGIGAEESGSPNDIWSHQWYLSSAGVGAYLTNDGVIVDRYTLQPEVLSDGQLVTIGVFCHEFGHALGLPDLYDTDNSSYGVGDWDIMGSGCWLGTRPGDTPSHFSAWCKWHLGWITPIQVKGFLINQTINCVETSGEVYQLLQNPNGPTDWVLDEHTGVGEYFLVENRYKTGFDAALPGEGLLIWHIDESMPNNDDETHKLVDLEEADGLNDLDNCVNCGDATDPWYNNSAGFTDTSNPNSNLYDGTPSGVKVINIGPPGPTMTADLIVEADVSLSIGDTIVPLNGTGSVYVSIWNNANLNIASGSVAILYNSSVAEFVDFEEGDFSEYSVDEIEVYCIQIVGVECYDRMVVIDFSSDEALTDSFITVGHLNFKGKLEGECTKLIVADAALYDEEGNEIQIGYLWNGSVCVARAMVQIENVTVSIGETAQINIKIIDFGKDDRIAGGTVSLSWCGYELCGYFNITDVVGGDFDEPVANVNNTEGWATITASRATAVEKPESVFAKITVEGLEETWWPVPIWICDELTDEDGNVIWPVLWKEGYVKVIRECPGDANYNGGYDSGDVTLIKQIIVGLKSPDEVYGNPDANQDGTITIQDAIKVQRWIVGLEEPPCGSVTLLSPKEKSSSTSTASTVQVESKTISLGEVENVSITIPNVKENKIAGAQIKLYFNPDIIRVNRVYAGDFGEPVTNVNNEEGWVFLAVSRATAPNESDAVIASIEIRGIGVGMTNLSICRDVSMIADENASVVGVAWQDGLVEVVQLSEEDTDNDNIPDWMEELFGTDPNTPDQPTEEQVIDAISDKVLEYYSPGVSPEEQAVILQQIIDMVDIYFDLF